MSFEIGKCAWALFGTTWRKVLVIEETNGTDGSNLITGGPAKKGVIYWVLFDLGHGAQGRRPFTPGLNLLPDSPAGHAVIAAAVKAGKATQEHGDAPRMTKKESDYPLFDGNGTRTLRSKKSLLCM